MPFQKGNKLGGRRSVRKSDIRTPTPQLHQDGSDEDMVDADAEETNVGTPQEDEVEDGEDGAEDDDADSPPTITTIPRRARGRGGRGRRSTRHDIGTPEAGEEGSESGTPVRRRRGRPPGPNAGRSRGGFRGRRRGVPPEQVRVMDRDGNALDVVNDEAVVDNDEEGNEKVDSLGNLQGGREYRVRTFTIVGRGERLYMLSTEPARCCGFRDSYLFFTKHPKLYKVVVSEDEKRDLIDRDILPNSYKGRNIGVVTARSVFREFGARIIVGGRRVTDDYKVTEARENGEVEGELADPADSIPENKEDYNRNRYVAWFGASEVYRQVGQGAGAVHPGKPGASSKRKNNNLTVTNWQHVHAREASRFNSTLSAARRANLAGVYDTHTNMMFYPQIMQPTHARWEQIPPPTPTTSEDKALTNGNNGINGTHEAPSEDTLFPPIPALISRNFGVIDTVFTSPSITTGGYPGPDGGILDSASGTHGLDSISKDVLAELPDDCRVAFEQAIKEERKWKRGWGKEVESGLRGGLTVGLTGWPV